MANPIIDPQKSTVQNNFFKNINWQKDVTIVGGTSIVITLIAIGIILGNKYKVCSEIANFSIKKGFPVEYNTLLSINQIVFNILAVLVAILAIPGIVVLSNFVLGRNNKKNKEIETLKGQIATLQNEKNKEIETLKGQIATLQNEKNKEIETLKGQIAKLQEENAKIKKTVNDKFSKFWNNYREAVNMLDSTRSNMEALMSPANKEVKIKKQYISLVGEMTYKNAKEHLDKINNEIPTTEEFSKINLELF
ncbi:MAG: hypothetical protein AMS24_02230 [Chlamydiae bacterium SM23_39]|nr:MAG: hypothetical protein AMS24_02230 [Chlamydiae bacterium SM23_39]